jgi:hypothetical protein
MIKNTIVFYYDNDSKVGDYFYSCAVDAQRLIKQVSLKVSCVQNENCNHIYVNTYELPKHNEKSLIVIYSHGDATSFLNKEGKAFIHESIECDKCLDGGLVYTNACSVGLKFGKNLLKKGASFYGYNRNVRIHLDYKDEFLECDNYGLSQLLTGKSLLESMQLAKVKFNEIIDRTYKDNILVASYLEGAKNSLVIHGELSAVFV